MSSGIAMISARLGLGLAIGLAILFPVAAHAQLSATGGTGGFNGFYYVHNPIFEQYDECTGTGAASQEFPDFGGAAVQSADDFLIVGTHVLDQFVAIGSMSLGGPTISITFEVFDSDGPGSLPGTLLCSEMGLSSTGSGNALDIALNHTCVLGSGYYWVSVMPVMSFAEYGQWYWSSNGTGYGSEFAFRDPASLLGNPCTTWGQGRTECGLGTTFPDLCFGIGDSHGAGDGGGGGVPAVGTTGSIVLAITLAALSYLFLRRRRAT